MKIEHRAPKVTRRLFEQVGGGKPFYAYTVEHGVFSMPIEFELGNIELQESATAIRAMERK